MLNHLFGHRDRVTGPATRGILIKGARFYDALTGLLTLGQERAVRAMTVDLAAVQRGERALEVGCGTGSLALEAARRVGASGKVYGIDPDPVMIDIARKKAAKARLDVTFEMGLIEKLPYDAAEFDVVLSSLMLHHLPADLQALGLAEVRRVLKPGGRFLAVDFEPPTSPVARKLVGLIFGQRMLQGGLSHLQPTLAAAGFTGTEWGRTRVRILSFLAGRAA
jgi:demethylmenaquinone methyltransferase/2-methoxy-6-polyprenyl-1,4-benzoquinol methylase/phosphoethanolamine N-methyltransferase